MKLMIKRRGTRENKNIKIEENKKKDNVLSFFLYLSVIEI